MRIASTPRRASALALAASAALSLPATAVASPIQDPQTVQPTAEQVRAWEPGGGPALAIPLAGGALALVVAGGGYLALRGPRLRPVSRVHAKT
jgi:hypothetical protein